MRVPPTPFSQIAAGALLVTALAVFTPGFARAQLMLPGAIGAPPPAEAAGKGGGGPPAPARPVGVKAPSESVDLGHVFQHNGVAGTLMLERSGQNLAVRQFALSGDSVEKPGETCRVDAVGGEGRVATPLGRPRGRALYALDLENCALSLDMLDGAVLVSSRGGACELARTTCRVDLTGLWGPAGASFSAAQAKDMERERVTTEKTMRANFHVLLGRAGKDHVAVKAVAAEQAGFSSAREVLCRDYAREATHGFCALTITQGRSLELAAALNGVSEEGAPAPVKPRKRKPKPGGAAAVAPPALEPAD